MIPGNKTEYFRPPLNTFKRIIELYHITTKSQRISLYERILVGIKGDIYTSKN